MSMDLGGAKGGVKSDINVTPLVDVMLVLLIIMMLIAPMLQQGVSVKLPTASNTVDKPEVQGQTVIAIGRDKQVYLNAKAVQEGELASKVNEALVETAAGLFVAIPAVWFYNYLSGRVEYFNVEMDNSSSELVDYFIKKTAA